MGSAEAFNRHYGVWWSLKKALSQFPKDALPKHHFNRDCANNLECADSHRFGVGDWALEMLCGGLDRNNFKTDWLQCHKNQQETTWPNRVNFDGHISCRNCESQTFATPFDFFHTQDIIVIPMEFFDLPKTVLLSVLTWLTVLFWSVDMLPLSWSNLTAGYVVPVTNAIFCPQNAKLCWGFPSRLASTGKASWSWNRRFFGNSEGPNKSYRV